MGRIAELIETIDIDGHAFATAYVEHVERTGDRPEIVDAIQRYLVNGRV